MHLIDMEYIEIIIATPINVLTQSSKGLRSHSLTYGIFDSDSLTHCLIVTDSLPDSLTD